METLTTQQTRCAHAGCTCPGVPEVASSDNKPYCSDACVDGKGCSHPGCNCAEDDGAGSPSN